MKISLLVLSWWSFSCLYIQRIGIQYTDQFFWKIRNINTLGTLNIIFINFNFLFFSFFWLRKLSQVHGKYGSMSFLTKYEINLIVHGFSFPSHYYGRRGGRWGLWQNVSLHLWQDKPIWVELKTSAGVIFITMLLHFH